MIGLIRSAFCIVLLMVIFASIIIWLLIDSANAQVIGGRHCFEQTFSDGVLISERCIEDGIVTESGRDVTPVARAPSASEAAEINTIATVQACSTAIADARALIATPVRAEVSALAQRLTAIETVLNLHGGC